MIGYLFIEVDSWAGKCLGTYNGLMPVGGSEVSGSTLGERQSGEIIDIVQMTQSSHGAKDSITWISSWASDQYIWAPSWASEIGGDGSKLGLLVLGWVRFLRTSPEQLQMKHSPKKDKTAKLCIYLYPFILIIISNCQTNLNSFGYFVTFSSYLSQTISYLTKGSSSTHQP